MSNFTRALAAPLLGVLAALMAQSSFAADWVKVAPRDGKYVIQMPAAPQEQMQQIDTPAGPAALHQYIVEVSPQEAYISSYLEASDEMIADASADQHLKRAEAGTLRGFPGARLRVDKATSVGSYPGRIFMLDVGEDSVYTACIYLVGNRLYQNVAVTPKATAGNSDVIRFLESFDVYKE
jgi:hypothetical protein